MDPLQSRADLTTDPLGVDLPEAKLRDVGGEVAEGGVLHGEHEVAVALEHGVVHPEDVLVGPQPNAALILAAELVRRHQVRVDRLEDHLVPGGPVLRQVDAGVPALADQLDKVIVSVNIDLEIESDQISRKRCSYHIDGITIFGRILRGTVNTFILHMSRD